MELPKTTLPRASVLVPVFNAESTLAVALESILNQSYDNFELLIWDDGSTDCSLEISHEVAGSDSRVKVFTHENHGIGVTLNRLISEADGEYLVRMDADDIAMPQRIERQIEFLDKNLECVAVGGAVETIDEDGDPIGILRRAPDHAEIVKGIIGERSRSGHIVHPSATLRASAMHAIGGYRPEAVPAEDLDLWLRLAEVGKLANLDEVVLKYRISSKGISQSRNIEQRDMTFAVVRDYRERNGLAWPPPRPLFKVEQEEPARTMSLIRRCCANGNLTTAKKYISKLKARDLHSLTSTLLELRARTPFFEMGWRFVDRFQQKIETIKHLLFRARP